MLRGDADVATVKVGLVTGNFFDVMGLSPVLARLTRASDDGPGAPPVTVLTHDFWIRRFGADSGIVGRRLLMDGQAVTVIGVLQPAPYFPDQVDCFTNMVFSEHHLSATMVEGRTHRMTELIGRLKPSATLDEADRKNELTVMDKEAVRKTRRSLFGLNLSGLPFIGGDDKAESDDAKSADELEGQTRITAKIASARPLGYGKWAFDLDDGAHWVTTEAMEFKDPAPGMTVVIKKGSLGGFSAGFDGGIRQVKVRRVN